MYVADTTTLATRVCVRLPVFLLSRTTCQRLSTYCTLAVSLSVFLNNALHFLNLDGFSKT